MRDRDRDRDPGLAAVSRGCFTPRCTRRCARLSAEHQQLAFVIQPCGPLTDTAPPPPRAAIGYTGQYRQTLLLHPTEPSTTVFAIGCTVVLGKLDDP